METSLLNALLVLASLGLLAIGITVYARLVKRVVDGRCKVVADRFGLPDLIIVALLGSWVLTMVVMGFNGPSHPIGVQSLVSGTILYAIVVSFILSFIHFRKIALVPLFGLRRLSFPTVARRGLGLILAALPLVGLVSVITEAIMDGKPQRQEIVEFFIDAAQRNATHELILTGLLAVIVAPLAEEIIFRGYFYGVLKRFIGLPWAMILTAALFAAVHLNAAALPALFVLALCFTLAYEVTGSLLVAIVMHALFNLTTLLVLLGQSTVTQ